MEPYQQLEQRWAEFNNLDPAGTVVCSSGTSALHLALEAMQLPQGSKVVCPDFTMVACARAISLAGLKPIFLDCKEDLNINADYLHKTGGDDIASPAAVMGVHVYGRRCNMDEIARWCTEAPLWDGKAAVEDLAEAHGVLPHPSTDAAAWSFYRNKIIHGEEGGAVWFRDKQHASLARKLRSLGFTDSHDFYHIPRGMNYRMSNTHAKLILESLKAYPENLKKRREAETILNTDCPLAWMMPERSAPWIYDLQIPSMTLEEQSRIVTKLNNQGIAARYAFKPMHVQEEYRNCRRIGGEIAEKMSREVIYLPMTLDVANRAEEVFDLILKELR